MECLHILLLEDNENDAELIMRELKDTLGKKLDFYRVAGRSKFLEYIKKNDPNIILSDYRLPQYDGLAALHDLKNIKPEIPFIIVTGTLTEEAAADAIKLGAWDYVVKERLFRLSSAVQNALKLKSERDQIKITSEQLRKSEERFRLISTSAQDAIVMMDENGRTSFWNPAAEQLFGYTPEEVLGTELHFLILTRESRQAYLNAFPEFKKEGNGAFISKTAELQGLHKNGTLVPVELSLARMSLEGKWGSVGIIRDISERKAAENALLESEAKYRHLIQHSEDAIYLLYNRRFEVANEKFKSMFRLTDEIVSAPEFDFMSLVAPQSRDMIKDRMDMHNDRENLIPNYEFTAITADGEEILVETSVTYMPYKDGWATQGIIRDITARRELESQLRQAQKMEVVGQLAGGVAHDFNNLLTIISGYCDLLLAKPNLDEHVLRYIHQISKAGQRARGLTNQLLAFSRKQVHKPVILDVNAAIENSMQMYSRLIGEDIDINLSLENDLPPIMADPHQIEQVLMNLLVNARDAIYENKEMGALKQIHISTSKIFLDKEFLKIHPYCSPGAQLMLAVSDSGVGMDSETVAKIFEPFFTTKELGHGTGLGLSTVYGIIKQNNGAIHVDSAMKRGTTINIYWPFVEANGESDMITVEKEEAKKGAESILFIEDDQGVREFAMDALESFGYNMHPAESAEEAIEIMRTGGAFDLFVVDLVLPGMSGTDFVEHMRELNESAPVIYISGYANDHVLLQTMSNADVHFIQKPYSMVTLTTKIREVLTSKSD